MVAAPRPKRRLGRGCGCLFAVALVLVIVTGVVASRALAGPDLGPPPSGPDNGDTQQQIAAHLAGELVTGLVVEPHKVVTLSEHDLTVLIRENNPDPAHFRDPEARVRDGLVVVDAQVSAGPLTVTGVGRVALVLSIVGDQDPTIAARLRGIDVGALGLPGFVVSGLEDRVRSSADMDNLLDDPKMKPLRSALECVSVSSEGVRLGFHRPGTERDTSSCI